MRDPEKRKIWNRKYYEKHPDRVKASQSKYHLKVKEKRKDRWVLREHGCSAFDYQRMLDEQEDGCAICGRPPECEKRLAVDHDHSTGEIRGLLCERCNQGLGLFGDSPSRLREAADYLEGKGSLND